jgi:hypothetical protein
MPISPVSQESRWHAVHDAVRALVSIELDDRGGDRADAVAALRRDVQHALTSGGTAPPEPARQDLPSRARLVNLTPHQITVIGDDGHQICLAPEPCPARVILRPDDPLGNLHLAGIDVPVVRTAATGAIVGLPEPCPGVLHVVSRIVAETARARHDLVFPHDSVRDAEGRVIGCRRLAITSRAVAPAHRPQNGGSPD